MCYQHTQLTGEPVVVHGAVRQSLPAWRTQLLHHAPEPQPSDGATSSDTAVQLALAFTVPTRRPHIHQNAPKRPAGGTKAPRQQPPPSYPAQDHPNQNRQTAKPPNPQTPKPPNRRAVSACGCGSVHVAHTDTPETTPVTTLQS